LEKLARKPGGRKDQQKAVGKKVFVVVQKRLERDPNWKEQAGEKKGPVCAR